MWSITALTSWKVAAPVFEVGALQQSPIPKIFLYTLCCKLKGFTSTYPYLSLSLLFSIN